MIGDELRMAYFLLGEEERSGYVLKENKKTVLVSFLKYGGKAFKRRKDRHNIRIYSQGVKLRDLKEGASEWYNRYKKFRRV